MKIERLKDARWTMNVGQEHRVKETDTLYHGGVTFMCTVDGKNYYVMYLLGHRLCIIPETIEDGTDEELADWVESNFTPNGFKSLYESLRTLLRNF
jgi:hypothetical protein